MSDLKFNCGGCFKEFIYKDKYDMLQKADPSRKLLINCGCGKRQEIPIKENIKPKMTAIDLIVQDLDDNVVGELAIRNKYSN